MAAETTLRTRKSLFILLALLIVVAIVKAQNMFAFPYYQDIEGTTLANGWALLTTGNLSPYTYAYEEPPIGSFLMSLWIALTGGLNTYGFSVNTGRVLMLGLHIMATALVYGITKKLTRSDTAATIATLAFAFSPLVTMLQRRVLLDNMMIVFLLAALYLILGDHRRLTHYILSAGMFGLAVLIKGNALFFAPALWLIIRQRADQHHRRFAVTLWTTLLLFLILFYPLYAQMKQELFPQGWLLGGDFPHVSLVERLADRGPDTGRFLNIGSGLAESFDTWVNLANTGADPVLIYGGLICGLFVLLFSLDNKNLRAMTLINVWCVLYLFLGGNIYDSAAILLLPFCAINVGVLVGSLGKVAGGMAGSNALFRFAITSAVALVILYPFYVFYSSRLDVYYKDQVTGQIEAIKWIQKYVPADAVVVTDNYAFTELRKTMENAHHYWKVDTDPAVKFNILNDNICSIDYLLTTPQVYQDIAAYSMNLMDRAYRSSQVLMTYPNNGWPVEVRQVSKQNCAPAAVGATNRGEAPVDSTVNNPTDNTGN